MKREATTELPTVVIVFRALLASALSAWIEENDPDWKKLRAGKIPDSLIEGILASNPPEVPLGININRLETVTKMSIPGLVFAAVTRTFQSQHPEIGSMADLAKAAAQVVKKHGLAKTCRKAGIQSRKVLRHCIQKGGTVNVEAAAGIFNVVVAEQAGKWDELPFLLEQEEDWHKRKKKGAKLKARGKPAPGDQVVSVDCRPDQLVNNLLTMLTAAINFIELALKPGSLNDAHKTRIITNVQRLFRCCGIDAETLQQLQTGQPLSARDMRLLAGISATSGSSKRKK